MHEAVICLIAGQHWEHMGKIEFVMQKKSVFPRESSNRTVVNRLVIKKMVKCGTPQQVLPLLPSRHDRLFSHYLVNLNDAGYILLLEKKKKKYKLILLGI